MSAKFKLTLDGEVLDVELYYDPDLEFEIHNKDLQFEVAAYEFGYPPTSAVHFLKSIKERPTTFLLEYLCDTDIADNIESSRLIDYLILDMAEHTIKIYEDVSKDSYLADTIKKTRSALKTEDEDHAPRSDLQNKGILRKVKNSVFYAKVRTRESDRAGNSAIDALKFVIVPMGDFAEVCDVATGIAFDTARAAGENVDKYLSDTELGTRASLDEQIWQARHLIHMIEVMQDGGDFRELRTP